jgi:O-antigen/teichoic acid export membrane protein
LRQGVRGDILVTLASQISLLVTGLLTGIVTARVLGPTGRGQLAIALLVPALLALLFGLGSTISGVYFVASGRLTVEDVTSNTSAFVLIATGAAAVLLVLLQMSGGLSAALPHLPHRYLVAAFPILPLSLMSNAYTAVVRGLQMMRKAAVLDALQGATSLIATLVALLALHTSVAGAAVAAGCGPLASWLAAMVVLRPHGMSLRPRLRRSVSLPVLGFGVRGDLANLTQFFSYRLDSFLVNAFVGAAAVGIYSIATRLAELLWVVPTAVSNVVLPRAAASRAEDLNRSTPRMFGRTLAVVAASAVVLAALSGPVIYLFYGRAFAAAAVPLLLLLPGIVLLGGATVLTNELAGRGHPGYNTINSVTGLMATVLLDLILIPRFGIKGAAIASTLAYTVNAVLAVWFFWRVTGKRISDFVRESQWWRV